MATPLLPAKFEVRVFSRFLAFNAHNLQGHVTVTTPPVWKFFQGHVGTFPRSMHAKLEVRTFRHFGAISI